MQFIANTLINHNGNFYQPGATLDLSSQEAEAFIGKGEISPVDVPFAKKVDSRFEVKITPVPLVELPEEGASKYINGIASRL